MLKSDVAEEDIKKVTSWTSPTFDPNHGSQIFNIDSSDLEMSPPRKRFADAGQMSINLMVDNAVPDRISSKKEVRSRTGAQYHLSESKP